MSVWMVFKKPGVAKALLEKLSDKGYLLDVDPNFLKKFKAVRLGFASLNESEMLRFVITLKNLLST